MDITGQDRRSRVPLEAPRSALDEFASSSGDMEDVQLRPCRQTQAPVPVANSMNSCPDKPVVKKTINSHLAKTLSGRNTIGLQTGHLDDCSFGADAAVRRSGGGLESAGTYASTPGPVEA